MDTTRRAWWEVRPVGLFYFLTALALARIAIAWIEPHSVVESTVWTIGSAIVAALTFAAATATLVRDRRRGAPSASAAPLAQENDPRLR